MTGGIAGKTLKAWREGGAAGLAAAVLRALHARTLGKLDLLLFYRLKWLTIRRWLIARPFYRAAALLGLTEAEHQLGRLLHMREALARIKTEGLKGDIVEFGSYQGFSLAWLARFRDELGLSMRVIGIDSFQGLPEASTIWKKGLFNDTSREACERNVLRACGAASLEELRVSVIQGLFDEPSVGERLARLTGRVALAHIDCDLGSSCSRALELVERTGTGDALYLLFDDWAWHPDEIPASFGRFLETAGLRPKAETLSSTRYTRYFRLARGGPTS